MVKKENRGEDWSNKYAIKYEPTMVLIEPNFGAAKHFVAISRDGEPKSGNIHYRQTP